MNKSIMAVEIIAGINLKNQCSLRKTDDVLWVKGILNGDTIHVFVNHWPSRVGGEQRSAPGRFAAAQVNKNFIDSIEKYKPDAKIIVMGDLNDDPVNESVTKVLGAKGKMAEVKPDGLYNPWVDLYKKGIGTLAYQDAWGLFDQIMINYPWLNKIQPGFFYYQQHIFQRNFVLLKQEFPKNKNRLCLL